MKLNNLQYTSKEVSKNLPNIGMHVYFYKNGKTKNRGFM